MLVISRDLVLSESEDINLTHPLIGWHNLVTTSSIVATTQEDDYPVTNLANPSTNLKWKGIVNSPAADEYLTVTTNEIDPTDYIAVAGHNWGSAAIAVSVGYFDTSSPPVWVELVEEVLLADDGPALFRFELQSLATISFRLRPGDAAPEAAVVYAGTLLVMERSFPAPALHTPIDFGRETSVVNGMSESGKFLGRIVVAAHAESVAEFQYLTPDWYRSYFDPFLTAAKEYPFFFAWNPDEYAAEVGYAWLINSPKPSVDTVTRRHHISLQMRGVV